MSTDKKRFSAKNITAIAFFAALISVLSQIQIPLPSGLPLTLQTFAVCLCGYVLGAKKSVICLLVYILLGMCGVPVFAGFGGGIYRLFGISGGFILSFPLVSALCGTGKEKRAFYAVLAGVAGVLLCQVTGALWYAYIGGMDFKNALALVLATYALKDTALCVAAYALSRSLKRLGI